MAFFEVEFPTQIGFGAIGGPTFNTTINAGFSGYEQRNRNWAKALGKWEIELVGKPQEYFDLVYAFWYNVGGRADGFRFKDHKDYKGLAQVIGTGNGSTTAFQLKKTYSMGGRSYVKPILKPIMADVNNFQGIALTNTVSVYVNGSKKTLTTDYAVNSSTGVVTFVNPPAAAAIVTADFEFHHPVRFDTDECKATIQESNVKDGKTLITWAAVQLVEIRINQQ